MSKIKQVVLEESAVCVKCDELYPRERKNRLGYHVCLDCGEVIAKKVTAYEQGSNGKGGNKYTSVAHHKQANGVYRAETARYIAGLGYNPKPR